MPSTADMMTAPYICSYSVERLVQVDQPTETGLALSEEEVADDGADDRQPRRDLESGEDRRHRCRVLQLAAGGSNATRR